MKVRLTYSSVDALPATVLSALSDVPRLKAIGFDGHFAPIGTEFLVYGIDFLNGNLFYRIGHPPHEQYVIQCLAALFEIVDPRVSRYWKGRMLSAGEFVLWPPSWFVDFYHDRLSDGDRELVEDFNTIKRLFAEEANSMSSLPMSE
jgi:hypothetical protein